jgi:diaminobutyrate-2-oxoglutarate transaminase
MTDDRADALANEDLLGPRTRALLAKQELIESNARTYPRNLPIAISQAAGSYMQDVDGRRYIDFLMGAGSLPLGHNHPEVVTAVQKQLELFTQGLDFPTEVKLEFARGQLEMLPRPMRDQMKIHFCGPTGADAVEAAIKLCKIATGRSEVIAFHGSYHGSTHAGLAVSSRSDIKGIVPNLMPGVHFFPFPYCYRCPLGLLREECDINCVQYLENILKDSHGGVPKPAAVIIELIQGEGGSIPAPREFVIRLREITAALEIPLIVDEIQSGCGRTGKWYSFQWYEIEPDLITASKGLSGLGLPVATMLYKRELDVWEPGAHIGTFRGNQLAFAGGLAMLDIVQRDHLLENTRRQGNRLLESLQQLRELRIVGDVRGLGLMLGIELAPTRGVKNPSVLARKVQRAALRRGLIVELGGRDNGVVRLLPALNVDQATTDDALRMLVEAFHEVDSAIVGSG